VAGHYRPGKIPILVLQPAFNCWISRAIQTSSARNDRRIYPVADTAMRSGRRDDTTAPKQIQKCLPFFQSSTGTAF
jgi:hypothetical protein